MTLRHLLLAGLITVSFFSVSLASFSGVVKRYKQITSCPIEKLWQKGEVQCYTINTDTTVTVGLVVDSGTVCDVAYSHTSHDQRYICEKGVWQNYGDVQTYRRKRFLDDVIGAVGDVVGGVVGGAIDFVGSFICFFFCSDPPPPPPPPKPPTINCPSVESIHYAPSRKTYAVVTWTFPTANDPEEGRLTPKLKFGLRSGSRFPEGSTSTIYIVTDKHGMTDTCDVSFTVKVNRCNSMPAYPRNGQMTCTPLQYDPILGTTCSFTCNAGYELTSTSSQTRTCQNNGYFDGNVAVCTKIQCQELENPDNGEKYCSSETYFNSVCATTCTAPGYDSEGGYTHCQSDGLWTAPLPSCQDNRAPHFTFCPTSPVRAYADKGKSSATVSWESPSATDNSGNFTITQTQGSTSGSEFSVGEHIISYVARDPSGQETAVPCMFTVSVKQLECDSPDGQFDDELILADCPGTEYTYGTSCNVSCIRNYDIIGNTTITCERESPESTKMIWDWGGGSQPTCNDKCPAIQPPANGAFVCQTAGNQYCRLSCDVAFGYPSGTSKDQMFVCTDHQLWDPPEADDCTERRPPDANSIGADLHYFVGNCSDTSVQEGLKDKFLAYMIGLVNSGWSNRCPNDTGCIRDDIEVICGPVTSRRKRETMGQYTGRWRPSSIHDRELSYRVKRSTNVLTFKLTFELVWVGGTTAEDLQRNDQDLYDIVTAIEIEIASGGGNISYNGISPDQITADKWPMMECPFGQTAQYYGDIPNCEGCATGKYYEANISDCAKCPVGTYQDEFHQTTCKLCPVDMSTKETGRKNISECFPVCPAGSYSASAVIPCTKCPPGEYQPNANSKSCNKCDTGKTTIASGQISASACTTYDVVLSSPEQNVTFADITASLEAFTLMFWMNCPLGNVIRPSFGFFRGGTYESMLNILDRQNFELFGSTIQVTMNGWTHITVRWSNTALRAELMIHGNTVGSTPVSIGYIMASGFHLQMSQSIGNNGSCRISGLQMKNTSRSDVDIQTDITTCTPSGEDAVYTMDNFKHKIGIDIDTPSMCDEVDECDSSPCGVHFCENLLNGYRCECRGGYTGDNCEIAPDYCVNHQCENGATCVSGEWNYTCTCASNFKGALCEDEIVNGNWAEWGTYSVCSQTCNGGTKTRVRTCTNPSPGPDGADCSVNSQDQVVCNTEPCPECEPFGLLLLQSRNTKEDGCVTEGDYTRCGIVCETGMEFVNPPKDYYECGANTSFEWNGIPPSCSRVRPGQRLTLDTSVTYPSVLPCGAETDLALLSAAGEAQCVRNNACTMSVSTTGCSSRRKRNTDTTAQISFIINLEDLNDFNLTALLEQNIVSADLQTYIDAITELEQTAQQINSSSSNFFSVNVNNVTYDIDTSTLAFSAVITCPNGSIANDGACVECPVGTSEDNGWCVFCDLGTYQDQEGQTECLTCPTGYTTQFVGMIDVANCSVEATTTSTVSSTTGSTSTSTTTVTLPTVPTSPTTATGPTTTPITATTTPTTTTNTPTTPITTLTTTTTTPTPTATTFSNVAVVSSTDRQTSSVPENGLPEHLEGPPKIVLIAVIIAVCIAVLALTIAIVAYFKVRKNSRKRFREQYNSQGSTASINMVTPGFPKEPLPMLNEYAMMPGHLPSSTAWNMKE